MHMPEGLLLLLHPLFARNRWCWGKVYNYYREIFYTLRQNKKKNTSSKQSQNAFGGKVHNYCKEIFYTLRQNKKKNTIIHPCFFTTLVEGVLKSLRKKQKEEYNNPSFGGSL